MTYDSGYLSSDSLNVGNAVAAVTVTVRTREKKIAVFGGNTLPALIPVDDNFAADAALYRKGISPGGPKRTDDSFRYDHMELGKRHQDGGFHEKPGLRAAGKDCVFYLPPW
jgi:hypothetical protein